MLTKVGTTRNYQDLFFQYMSFLSVGILGTNSISPWLIIDPRLDTFFGSTLVVPIDNYEVKDDILKIWVDYNDNVLTCEQSSNFYDDPYMPNGEYNNLFDTLKYCYPNGQIVRIYSPQNSSSIQAMNSYLPTQPVNDLPDVIICSGVLKLISLNGNVWGSNVESELNTLFTFCESHNIKLYCCLAPYHNEYQLYDSVFNQLESFISTTGERLVNLPVVFVDMFGSLNPLYNTYVNYVYSHNYQGTLVRKLLQEFMGLDRPEYYVSFELRTITEASYRDFLYNYGDYQSEEFDKTENGERRIHSKDSTRNPFKRVGQFCAIGLHTSYDDKLWMCEQGGITCKKEADAQIEDLDMMPFYQFWDGEPEKRRDIVVYPGTGCPWLTIATVDFSKFGIDADNPINYYFTKDDRGSTITVRICDKNTLYPDVWQSIEFGRFTHTEGELYPLYVGGGNLALSPDTWIVDTELNTKGLRYNLGIKNPALSNSNILHTTKFGSANMSNFRVMSQDGLWRDIYSAYQEYKEISYFTFSRIPTRLRGECLLEHTYSNNFNTGAELVDTRGKTGVLRLVMDVDRGKDKYYERTNLDEITVALNYSISGSEYLSTGVIPRVYASWGRHLIQGLHSYGGRYWLAIPDGWEDRLWQYRFFCGHIYWGSKNEESPKISSKGYNPNDYTRNEYHQLTEGRYNGKMINDKLVLDFGKAPVECSDLAIIFPSDYPDSTQTSLILRALVHADSDTILFSLFSNTYCIEVDFGDGTKTQFSSGSQILHTYNSSGDYYIDIYIACSSTSYHSVKYQCSSYDTGFIYSDTHRNNVLKELYLNPYCADAIFIDNTIISADVNIGNQHGANIMYLYNQKELRRLYLPYLAKTESKFVSSIFNNTWFSWFSIINCDNLDDVYIFMDYSHKYSTYHKRHNSACIFISNSIANKSVNVYVSDKYNFVCVNNFSMGQGRASLDFCDQAGYNVNLPNVNLYLYNKTLVDLGYDAYIKNIYQKSLINLYVPSNLFNDYANTYVTTGAVASLVGNIT